MKILKGMFLNMMMLIIILNFSACSTKNKNDSKDVTKEKNDDKFEDTKIEKDIEFAVEAADGGMLEVQLGRLAQTKSTTAQVKMLGKMMADDHGKANEELRKLAAQKNISLSSVLSVDCQNTYNDLAAKTGKDFDDAYTELMVKDHKDDIDEFKKEADKGNDLELKSWAAGKIATLERHLEMAKQAEDVVDKMK